MVTDASQNGDEARKQVQNGDAHPSVPKMKSFIVNGEEKQELEGVSADLAIVSPLADGRMLDVAEGRSE